MIDRLIIENFKSIRKLELTLNPINVLIGSNGAGKSNFIGFLKFLTKRFENDLNNYVLQNGGADTFLYFGRKESSFFSGQLSFKDTNKNEDITDKYTVSFYPDTNNSLFPREEDITYKTQVGMLLTVHNLSENPKLFQTFTKIIDSFKIYHFHDTSNTALIKQTCNVNDNKTLKEDGSNLAAFLYLLQEKYPKDFKRIEAVVRSIAPFFDRFDLEPSRLNEQFIQLEWKEKGAPDMYLNAYNLSDGTLRMIALTTLLMQPNPPKTIIIDEPELGLHPFAINKLAGLIKMASANSQIIVSTQSTNLISNFTPEDIITVDREDKQSIFKRLDSESLETWLTEYSLGEIWEKNLIGGRP